MTPQDKPLISVCIPTYNRADMLAAAIESALCQTKDDFELLIVDNDSSDHTAEVVESFSDKRIKYLKNEKTVSMYANHNICVARASADYVVFLHSDDTLNPEALSIYRGYLDRLSDVSVIVPKKGYAGNENEECLIGIQGLPRLYSFLAVAPTGSLFSRAVLLSHPFNQDSWASDLELCSSILLAGGSVVLAPDAIVNVGQGQHQASFGWGRSGRYMVEVSLCLKKVLETQGVAEIFLEQIPSWTPRQRAKLTRFLAIADEKNILQRVLRLISFRELFSRLGRYKLTILYLLLGRRLFSGLIRNRMI